MNLTKIFISKFKSQIPKCGELIEGEILINYEQKTIVSKAEYLEDCGCYPELKSTKDFAMILHPEKFPKKIIEDTRELDENTEATFEALLGNNSVDWEKINILKIRLTTDNIYVTIFGIKSGVKGRETFEF